MLSKDLHLVNRRLHRYAGKCSQTSELVTCHALPCNKQSGCALIVDLCAKVRQYDLCFGWSRDQPADAEHWAPNCVIILWLRLICVLLTWSRRVYTVIQAFLCFLFLRLVFVCWSDIYANVSSNVRFRREIPNAGQLTRTVRYVTSFCSSIRTSQCILNVIRRLWTPALLFLSMNCWRHLKV
jgi:hypothetical protein